MEGSDFFISAPIQVDVFVCASLFFFIKKTLSYRGSDYKKNRVVHFSLLRFYIDLESSSRYHLAVYFIGKHRYVSLVHLLLFSSFFLSPLFLNLNDVHKYPLAHILHSRRGHPGLRLKLLPLQYTAPFPLVYIRIPQSCSAALMSQQNFNRPGPPPGVFKVDSYFQQTHYESHTTVHPVPVGYPMQGGLRRCLIKTVTHSCDPPFSLHPLLATYEPLLQVGCTSVVHSCASTHWCLTVAKAGQHLFHYFIFRLLCSTLIPFSQVVQTYTTVASTTSSNPFQPQEHYDRYHPDVRYFLHQPSSRLLYT